MKESVDLLVEELKMDERNIQIVATAHPEESKAPNFLEKERYFAIYIVNINQTFHYISNQSNPIINYYFFIFFISKI